MLIANDEVAQLEIEGDDEDIDADPTVAEEMGYDDVQKALRRLQRARKNVGLEKQTKAVDDMQQTIAEQQAQLVELQATVDLTKSALQGIAPTIEELHDRSRALTARQAQSLETAPTCEVPVSQAQPKTGEQYLQHIGRDLLAGAQNLAQEAPQIQKMLLDLMAALDGMRGGQQAALPGQRTLPHMFGKQAPAPSHDQAPQGKPIQYDISDSQPTDPLVGDTGGGEKRKLEQISSQQGDDSGSCTGDEKPMEVVHVVPTAPPRRCSAQPTAARTG